MTRRESIRAGFTTACRLLFHYAQVVYGPKEEDLHVSDPFCVAGHGILPRLQQRRTIGGRISRISSRSNSFLTVSGRPSKPMQMTATSALSGTCLSMSGHKARMCGVSPIFSSWENRALPSLSAAFRPMHSRKPASSGVHHYTIGRYDWYFTDTPLEVTDNACTYVRFIIPLPSFPFKYPCRFNNGFMCYMWQFLFACRPRRRPNMCGGSAGLEEPSSCMMRPALTISEALLVCTDILTALEISLPTLGSPGPPCHPLCPDTPPML